MNLFTGIVVFLLIWWTSLFTILPLRHKPADEETGTGAPENPHIKFKILVTTGISVILWIVLYILIKMEVINFRDLARAMIEEDRIL